MPARKTTRATPKTMKSWSASRFADYDQCPAKAKFKHIDKLKEPENEAMARGVELAKASEDYLTKQVRTLHKELKPMAPQFKFLRDQKNLFVEENWGFDKDWNAVDYFDWNNCELRVKVDAGYVDLKRNVLIIVDNKSGKYNERKFDDYENQLEIYTAAGIVRYPYVKAVEPRLHYTDHNIVHPQPIVSYTAAEAVALQKKWTLKVRPLLRDTRFAPNPGVYCRWCHYRKSNGGPCRF